MVFEYVSSAKEKEEKEAKAKIKKDQEKREMAQALEASLSCGPQSARLDGTTPPHTLRVAMSLGEVDQYNTRGNVEEDPQGRSQNRDPQGR